MSSPRPEKAVVRLGRVVAIPNALKHLTNDDVITSLQRHESGDWGDLDEEDRQANDYSLKNGLRLLSAYRTQNGTKFWVITDADRSVTTLLLPEDY